MKIYKLIVCFCISAIILTGCISDTISPNDLSSEDISSEDMSSEDISSEDTSDTQTSKPIPLSIDDINMDNIITLASFSRSDMEKLVNSYIDAYNYVQDFLNVPMDCPSIIFSIADIDKDGIPEWFCGVERYRLLTYYGYSLDNSKFVKFTSSLFRSYDDGKIFNGKRYTKDGQHFYLSLYRCMGFMEYYNVSKIVHNGVEWENDYTENVTGEQLREMINQSTSTDIIQASVKLDMTITTEIIDKNDIIDSINKCISEYNAHFN